METVDLTAAGASTQLGLAAAAVLEPDAVLTRLGGGEHGLAGEEARRRLDGLGPNVLAIILTIIGLSVGLGFLNEFRSEKAVEALHSQIRRTALVACSSKLETERKAPFPGPFQ